MTKFTVRNYVLVIADNSFVSLRDSRDNSIHLSTIDNNVELVKKTAIKAAKLGGANGAALLTKTFNKVFDAA